MPMCGGSGKGEYVVVAGWSHCCTSPCHSYKECVIIMIKIISHKRQLTEQILHDYIHVIFSLRLIDWAGFNVPHYRSYRGQVLRVKWPNQQWQSTEGSSSPKDRLQSHQVDLTMLQYYTVHIHAIYSQTQNNTYTVKWAQWDQTQSRELLGLFMCVHCTVHNCCTQYSTEQTW